MIFLLVKIFSETPVIKEPEVTTSVPLEVPPKVAATEYWLVEILTWFHMKE